MGSPRQLVIAGVGRRCLRRKGRDWRDWHARRGGRPGRGARGLTPVIKTHYNFTKKSGLSIEIISEEVAWGGRLG
jgi:hypothetical protein